MLENDSRWSFSVASYQQDWSEFNETSYKLRSEKTRFRNSVKVGCYEGVSPVQQSTLQWTACETWSRWRRNVCFCQLK